NMVAEILDGDLYLSPRPASPHAFATTKIVAALDGPFANSPRLRDTGGWWFLVEPELHLHGEVIVPDVAGWRRERMPVVPDTAAIDLTPDWVCEALSPSTVRLDRKKKVITYAREKVPYLWFVDAKAQTLEPYELSEAGYVIREVWVGDEKARVPPFD